jgi:hypothetical protein
MTQSVLSFPFLSFLLSAHDSLTAPQPGTAENREVKKRENNKTITNQIFNTIENQYRPQFLLKAVGGGKKTKTGTHFEHLGNKRNNRKRVLSQRQTESRKNKTAKKKQSKTNAVTCKRRESESLGKMRRRGRSVGRRLCECEKRREEKRRGRKEGRKEGAREGRWCGALETEQKSNGHQRISSLAKGNTKRRDRHSLTNLLTNPLTNNYITTTY